MIKYLVLLSVVLFANSAFSQAPKIKSKDGVELTFNLIDTIDANTWVVDFEFWDRIDTIKYFQEKKAGYIFSYSKTGSLTSIETYKMEGLKPPEIGIFYSEFHIEGTEIKKGYHGQDLNFSFQSLVRREFYHKNGKLKEVQEFRFGDTECTVITFEPETYREIVEKHKCRDRIKSGIWKWYDIYGNMTKEENYRNEK